MSRNKYLVVFSYIFTATLLWFMSKAFGGWTNLAKVMSVVLVGHVAIAGCMLATVGLIYYLTIYRSNRYASRLRDAGYKVSILKDEVWSFAMMALVALLCIPGAIWVTGEMYSNHLCIQSGRCYTPEGWYFTAPFITVMMWLLAITGFCTTVVTWWKSFRPLRKQYAALQQGQPVDLPRLR